MYAMAKNCVWTGSCIFCDYCDTLVLRIGGKMNELQPLFVARSTFGFGESHTFL